MIVRAAAVFSVSCSSARADCLLSADLLHSWPPSGHPGRFTSRGRDRAMARRGHHGDGCQHLCRGGDCQLVRVASVCVLSPRSIEIC